MGVDASRWAYLSKSRAFFASYFASGPIFSILTSLPWFDGAVDDDEPISISFAFVIGSVAAVCVGFIVWHAVYAHIVFGSSKEFYAFIIFRLSLIIILSITYYLVHSEPTNHGYAKFHLHHYFVAWMLSLMGAFNHKLSSYFLAVTTGIFVQGISAYSAASMFYRGDREIPCPEIRIS